MFWQKSDTHAVPSACSRWPPVGSGALRSNTPMLSRPRKPPSKRFLPKRSLRFTHQLKFSISFANDLRRNARSLSPVSACSVRYKKIVDHVEPFAVAYLPAARPQRIHAMFVEPFVHVEPEVLLAPQHPGQRLAHH